ncbi:MAG: hypothetical protein WA997_02655 [Anaerolineales bacterium]|jgi:hypothetical protein|nr:hypothetical protein [Anaerolineales bacterium]
MEENELVNISLEDQIEHGILIVDQQGYTAKFNPERKVREPGIPGTFMPFRFVIDLELVPDPNPAEGKENYQPQLIFRVYFTKDEIKGRGPIKLGKFIRTWIVLSDNPIFILNHSIWAGYFEITFTEPGDPPIALGE